MSKKKNCSVCGNKIVTMIYKGSGVCGEACRKVRDNDTEPFYPGSSKRRNRPGTTSNTTSLTASRRR